MPDYSNTRIQVRRGSSSQWAAANTILSSGEPGYDQGSGVLKVGDGVTGWNSLAAIGGAGGPSNAQFSIVSGIAVYASGNAGGGGGDVSTAQFNIASGIAVFSSGQSIALQTSTTNLNTASGALNTNVGLLNVASGALNTSVGARVQNNTTLAGSSGSLNVSGVNNIVFTDLAGHSGIAVKDTQTLYFIVNN